MMNVQKVLCQLKKPNRYSFQCLITSFYCILFSKFISSEPEQISLEEEKKEEETDADDLVCPLVSSCCLMLFHLFSIACYDGLNN